MNYLMTTVSLHGLVFLILCVLPMCASTFLSGAGKELWPYIRIKCGFMECPYGYETDVEGSPICECHDPCKYVFCMDQTKCVIHVPKTCDWKRCKPLATCADVDGKASKKRQRQQKTRKINLYTTPLSDAAPSSQGTGASSMCYLQLTERAKDCKRLRRRWFFDPETGKCRKFRGCKTDGNNFGRKKRCKRKCMRKRKSPKIKARVTKGKRRRGKQ